MEISVQKINSYSGHKGAIYALAFDAETGKVYTSGADGWVVEWQLDQPENGRLLAKIPNSVYALYFCSVTRKLHVGSAEGDLYRIDPENLEVTDSKKVHTAGIYYISGGTQHLFTGGGDGMICAFDLKSLRSLAKSKIAEKSVRIIKVWSGSVWAGTSDCTIVNLDFNLQLIQRIENAHNSSVFSFELYEQSLISGGRDAMINQWEIAPKLKQTNSVAAHNLHVHSLALQPGGKLLLSCSMDKTIKIWNASNMKLLKVLDFARYQGHTNAINKVLWVNDAEFVSVGDDKMMHAWRLIS